MNKKIDLLNTKIQEKLGEEYIGTYIPYNTPLFHLEPLFELYEVDNKK